ncbi:hypothetical protein PMAYCL1PPCAC_27689, partial [Pristionchus mayeri]
LINIDALIIGNMVNSYIIWISDDVTDDAQQRLFWHEYPVGHCRLTHSPITLSQVVGGEEDSVGHFPQVFGHVWIIFEEKSGLVHQVMCSVQLAIPRAGSGRSTHGSQNTTLAMVIAQNR